MKKLFIITGEYSGDIHASHVVEALRAVNPDIEIEGIGGENLRLVEATYYGRDRYRTAIGKVRQVDSTFRMLILIGEGGQPDARILFEDIWNLRPMAS